MRIQSILLATAALTCPQMVWAAQAEAMQSQEFAISLPAQSLAQSLYAVSRATGVQLVFTESDVLGVQAPALSGSFTANEMLDHLLRGTGFTYRRTNADTVRVFRSESQSASADAPARSEIVVTGTRIASDTGDTTSPVVEVDREFLEDAGAQDLSETLAELPFVSLSNSATSDGGNAQSEGLQTINLRSLGDSRVLVLIDGRRAVSNSAQANRISLSSIPDDFIDRVEIITGGASSIYGSDAIAGVVNIITETGQTGLKLRTQAGITDDGDDERFEAGASWGTRFAQDRGYFFISGGYEKRWGIAATDRERALIEADFDYNTDLGINEFSGIDPDGGPAGDFPADTFPPNLMRDRSTTFFPGGIFDVNISGDDPLGYYNGTEFVYLGTEVDANDVAERYGETDRIYNNILNPRTRYLGAAKLNFEVSDATELFGQIMFAREETLSRRRPQSWNDSDDFSFLNTETGLFEFDNGVGDIGDDDEEDALAQLYGPDIFKNPDGSLRETIDWNRRFDEVGQTETENTRTTIRSWLGARGNAWGDWEWEASFGYGDFTQKQVRRNEINLRALEQGIQTEFVPGSTTEVRCQSAEARAQGCVPVNLFGVGSISPAAADYIRADLELQARITQQTFQGFLNGSLFDLPAGPVRSAFGIDYRRDKLELRNDELSRLGGTTEITVPDTDGSISAFEGFAELQIPLLADQPFFKTLDLDVSARVAEYDIQTVGTVFTYRGGLSWRPVDDIQFRVQYARAERAPDLTELFSPPRGDTDSGISDPCDGVTATTPGAVGANCRADPGIAAMIAEDGVFESEEGSLFSTNEGNINLESETSDSFTAGTVLSPSFVPGLVLSVDYYNITVDNVIELFDNELLLSNCYDSDLAVGENPFCARIARDLDNGEVVQIRQFETNSDKLATSGLDFGLQYRMDLDGLGMPGRLDFSGNATHVLKHEVTRLGETIDTRNSLDEADAYKWRAVGSVAWRHDGFRIRYKAEYFSPVLDSRERLLDYQELLEELPNAEEPLFLRYPAYWEHSISANYEFDLGGTEMQLKAGVNNLFDKISPFAPDGDVRTGRRANFNRNYDVRGRRFYLGLEARF